MAFGTAISCRLLPLARSVWHLQTILRMALNPLLRGYTDVKSGQLMVKLLNTQWKTMPGAVTVPSVETSMRYQTILFQH